jgi:hypothetical protein
MANCSGGRRIAMAKKPNAKIYRRTKTPKAATLHRTSFDLFMFSFSKCNPARGNSLRFGILECYVINYSGKGFAIDLHIGMDEIVERFVILTR